MKENPGSRHLILVMLFVLFAVFLLYNLYVLQIVRGDEFYEKSQNSIYREIESASPRGGLLDRNGFEIALNRHGYAVDIFKTDIDTQTLNRSIHRIVGILDENGDDYCNSLGYYIRVDPLRFNLGQVRINKWQKDVFDLKDDEINKTPRELLDYLRVIFDIDDSYVDTEAFGIMRVRYEIFLNEWSFINFNPVRISGDISRESVSRLEECHHEMPGVTTEVIPKRKYWDARFATHVVGYVGPIPSDRFKEWEEDGYKSSDIVGITGMELAAEKYLRGKSGRREVEVDTKGRLKKVLNEEPAVPGKDVILTIDMELQKVGYHSLEKNIAAIKEGAEGSKRNHGDANAGAVVALDVNSGEVLAMVSYPGYDPSIFLNRNDSRAQKQISMLSIDSKNKPFVNRALQHRYAPGSTFKPLVAIAALEEGVITPDTIIMDKGYVEIGGKDFYCLEYIMGLGAHGKLKLERALATSCNIFFHITGVETTIDKIDKWSRYFGLGEKTGIELYEEKGIRANREYKMETYGEQWWIADTAQAAIGQLYNDFTLIQLANYAACIANGGRRYRPHLIKEVINPDGSLFMQVQPEYEEIPVSQKTLAAVREGMRSVANSVDGTAEWIFRDFPVNVAGKTGTAETGRESDQSSNALFVCYAPAENPQIAVAVVVEHGVWGSYTAPIARDVLAAYFGIYESEAD